MQVKSSPDEVIHHNIFDILGSSLADHPKDMNAENEVRYKLVIDPSEDGSLVRLLFSCGVLQRSTTRVYMCSEFSGDAELHKVCSVVLHITAVIISSLGFRLTPLLQFDFQRLKVILLF